MGMVAAVGICLRCFSSPVGAVRLLLSCWLRRYLRPCEQMLAHVPLLRAVCFHVSMLISKAFNETSSVRLCSAFSGLLGSASRVAVHHRSVS